MNLAAALSALRYRRQNEWALAPALPKTPYMEDQFALAETAAQSILQRTPLRPRIGLVLGSGLGGFADSLTDAARIPFPEIPAFPRSTAIGHAGQIVIGNAGAVPVAVMQGRVHLYEGYSPHQVAFPMRVFGRMGIRSVILTNAAGGINLNYQQGALVLIRDHINLQGTNPLVGSNDDRFGVRFPDMTHAYAKDYRAIAHEEAAKLGNDPARRRLRRIARPQLRNPRRDKLSPNHRCRPGRHVDRLRGDRSPSHGNQGGQPSPASPTWPPES